MIRSPFRKISLATICKILENQWGRQLINYYCWSETNRVTKDFQRKKVKPARANYTTEDRLDEGQKM